MIWPLKPRRPPPLDPLAWNRLLEALPYLRDMSDDEADAMRALVAEFVAAKTLTGTHGLVPDDAMRIAVAAQACLPVLRLGLAPYADFVEIVVYPSAFRVQRRVVDEDGLVHEYADDLVGEAMDGGPVVLSWDVVFEPGAPRPGNVVIHEFAHKLDMADGDADGCPPMPASRRDAWRDLLGRAFDRFRDQVERAEARIPADVDPESPEADRWYDGLPLDPYAATDEAEFFAVACESFFVDPARFATAFPALRAAFVAYFRTDPLAWHERAAARR